MKPIKTLLLGAMTLAFAWPIATSGGQAQAMKDRDGYDVVGVKLSERERRNGQPVRLSDGRVAVRPYGGGLPWLYGFGDVRGKASGLPVVNGVTPSIKGSTPSSGLVPGQEPR